MSYTVTLNGVTYTLPNHGDTTSWDNITNGLNAYFAAIPAPITTLQGLVTQIQALLPGNASAGYNLASAQTFNTGVTSIINYTTREFDTNNAVTTGSSWKFTVPNGESGTFLIAAALTPSGAVASGTTLLQVYKNFVLSKTLWKSAGAIPSTTTIRGECMLSLVAGDTVDVRFTQATGSSVGNTATAAENYICISRLQS